MTQGKPPKVNMNRFKFFSSFSTTLRRIKFFIKRLIIKDSPFSLLPHYQSKTNQELIDLIMFKNRQIIKAEDEIEKLNRILSRITIKSFDKKILHNMSNKNGKTLH